MAAKYPPNKGGSVVSRTVKKTELYLLPAHGEKKIINLLQLVEQHCLVDNGAKEVDKARLVKQCFGIAKAIDIHNHIKQDGLALEKAWGKRKWKQSICFCFGDN